MLPTSDADDHLIEVPNVIWAWRLAAKEPGILRTERLAPPADRLVRNDDTALMQHLLDQAHAQRKSEVQPNRMGDVYGGKRRRLYLMDLGMAPCLLRRP